mgnify:CR=1 FL=1
MIQEILLLGNPELYVFAERNKEFKIQLNEQMINKSKASMPYQKYAADSG